PMLDGAGMGERLYRSVGAEPTSGLVDDLMESLGDRDIGLVIGAGGGSPIDVAKAIAALLTNRGQVEDYLEGVGQGFKVEAEPVPTIAIPTTAGTGAEVTKNSVIANHEKGYKKSMRDEKMIPNVVIVDPDLHHSVPTTVTAACGMDAVTQLIEPCISTRRTEATTALALGILPFCHEALARCCEAPDDTQARKTMARASTISGVCLANSGLALAHGIASGMGAVVDVPHGLICGILLPHTLRWNRDACEAELQAALSAFLNRDNTTIEDGIQAIEAMNARIGVPADFKHLELPEATWRRIAEKSMGSSMSGNPAPMTPKSTYDFLRPLT
ncbi:MAG: iron-containing alcohol dehydrogenase, partial [Verrucomicrobiota bacterium]